MCEIIMVGCDLHAQTMLLKMAVGLGPAETVSVRNTQPESGETARLAADLRAAGGRRVIFVYGSLRARLRFVRPTDRRRDRGATCWLPPKSPARSNTTAARPTNETPSCCWECCGLMFWPATRCRRSGFPDPQTRDDRELVRTRLDLASKLTAIKAQIQGLLKRNYRERPEAVGKGWTRAFVSWLRGLTGGQELAVGAAAAALASLLRQRTFWEEEIEKLDEQLYRLAESSRYQAAIRRMMGLKGVGVLTALVFLTEMGDLNRFTNRREVGAYLGLVPTSYESGSPRRLQGAHHASGLRSASATHFVPSHLVSSAARRSGVGGGVPAGIAAKNPKQQEGRGRGGDATFGNPDVACGPRRTAARIESCGSASGEGPEAPVPSPEPPPPFPLPPVCSGRSRKIQVDLLRWPKRTVV